MTTEDQRKSLYAALLRYAPETGSLRDRILDRLVLVALLESTESAPLRIGTIQENIEFGPGSSGLRTEVIQETLARLIAQAKVKHAELRTRHAYFLTEVGVTDVSEATDSAAALFEPVLARMLADTSSVCSQEEGATVCRRFISECFARFGQQIAKSVTGELSHDKLIDTIDARAAFITACEDVALSPEAAESLKTRCFRFLLSIERQDQELKFRLTQGYYIAQLLGLDSAQFNPIINEAFQGAVFYVDTNVLIPHLLSSESARFFDEVLRFASRLGIEIRVTRATIEEIRQATIGRLEDLTAVTETVPTQLAEKTQDQILQSFLALRNEQPELTPGAFLRRFEEIPQTLQKLGITIDDRDANEIVGDRDVTKECKIVNDAAEATRGWGKHDVVQLHDVCHFLLVQEERSRGNKAWFLTRDRTLSHAAVGLSKDELPFCFPLVGFLQSISPFLETPAEESSLVGLFSAALEQNIRGFPTEALFDLQELKLIGELHADVLSTSPDQLLLAFDYVKSNILNGKPYRLADHTKVALELKKFLASTADERHIMLQAEAHRQHKIAASERTKRELAEREAADEQERAEKLESEIGAARRSGKKARSRESWLRAALMFLGAVIAVGIWSFDSELAKLLGGVNATLGPNAELFRLGIRACGSLAVVITSLPAVFVLRSVRLPALTVISAIALGGLDPVGSELLSTWSGYLGIAAPLAVALLILLGRSDNQEV